MITVEHIMMILTTVLGLGANGMAAVLFWRIKRMDSDIEMLKQDITQVRMNYLNRFQDVKDHNTTLHLQLLDKISILDRSLAAHFGQASNLFSNKEN